MKRWMEDRPYVVFLLAFVCAIVVGGVVGSSLTRAMTDDKMPEDHPCIVALEHSEELIWSSIQAMRISGESIEQLTRHDYDGVREGSDELRQLNDEVSEITEDYDSNRMECMAEAG